MVVSLRERIDAEIAAGATPEELPGIIEAYRLEVRPWLRAGQRPPRVTQPPPAPPLPVCIHQGERAGVVKVACKGCGGTRVNIEHRSAKCDIFGFCLPTFRGPWDKDHEIESKLYALCRPRDGACPHYEPRITQSPTPT